MRQSQVQGRRGPPETAGGHGPGGEFGIGLHLFHAAAAQQRPEQRQPWFDRGTPVRQAGHGCSLLGNPGPAVGLARFPGHGGKHRRHNGGRGLIRHSTVIFEPPQPPLGRRNPALLVGRKRQRANQASRGICLTRLHPVLHCLTGFPVALVPLRRSLLQDRNQAGLQAVQLRQEQVAEQVVIAVHSPAVPAAPGADSTAPARPASRPSLAPLEHRVAQRPGHALQGRGAGQERQ